MNWLESGDVLHAIGDFLAEDIGPLRRIMNQIFRTIAVVSLLAVGSFAQGLDEKIEGAELLSYLETSRTLTKDMSYRRLVEITDSEIPTGRWKPYSSMMYEAVFPDRATLTYITRMQKQFIRIGKYLYSREDTNSTWVRSESKDWVSIPNNPAAKFGFPPTIEFARLSSSAGVVVKIVAKRQPDADEKGTEIKLFSFDEKGILFRTEWIGFNGYRFVRRVENYQYDNDLRIEAPIKYQTVED